MKKRIIFFTILISLLNYSKDIEFKIKLGTELSFGIEGIDIDLDKEKTIRLLLPREDKFKEAKTDNINEFSKKIKKLLESAKEKPKTQVMSKSNKEENKADKFGLVKEIVKKGIVLDAPIIEGEVNIKKINTKIGARIEPSTLRFNDEKYSFNVQRAYIQTDTDTNIFKMTNTLYIKGYEKERVGFDKLRLENKEKTKDITQFNSSGVLMPDSWSIRPRLAYMTALSKKAREIAIATGVETDVIKTANKKLTIGANYHFSNFSDDLLNIDELKKDSKKLSPGYTKVEYFKNWELGKNRNIENGVLTGKRGSIRSVGLPTGTLYGTAVMDYALNLAYTSLIKELGKKGKEIDDLLEKVQKGKKMTLDDFVKLTSNDEGYAKLANHFKNDESFLKFIAPFVDKALYEFKMKTNDEVSSYHVQNFIPKDYIDYLKYFKKGINEKIDEDKPKPPTPNPPQPPTPKPPTPNPPQPPAPKPEPTPEEKPKKSIADDIDYLFPKGQLKGVEKFMEAPNLIGNIKLGEEIYNGLKDDFEYLGGKFESKDAIKNTLLDITKEGVYFDWFIPKFDINRSKTYKNLKKSISNVSNELLKNKKKINEALEKNIAFLKTLNDKDDKKIKESIKELENRKKEIETSLSILENINKTLQNLNVLSAIGLSAEIYSKWGTIKSTINSFKNYKEAYLKPVDEIIGIKGTEYIKGVSDIVKHPERVESFDMFRGLQILKSENDIVGVDFTSKLNKYIDKEYKPYYGVAQGINVNINYSDLDNCVFTNLNLDNSIYRNNNDHLYRVTGLLNFIYEPKFAEIGANLKINNRDIAFKELKYNKLNLDADMYFKLKVKSKNSKWIFKPGISYVGNFEHIFSEQSPVSVDVYKRENGMLIKKKDAPKTNNKNFDEIVPGSKVDISKYSKYLFKEGLDKYFEKEKKSTTSKWLKPVNILIPSMEIVYKPNESYMLNYGVAVPIKYVEDRIDGVMMKHSLGLTINF